MNTLKWRLRFIVALHYLIVGYLAVGFIAVPFLVPIWAAPFILILIARIATEPSEACPLTKLENKLRRELGLEPIDGFIGHHILRKRK